MDNNFGKPKQERLEKQEKLNLSDFMIKAHEYLSSTENCDYRPFCKEVGIELYDCEGVAQYIFNLLKENQKHPQYLVIGGEEVAPAEWNGFFHYTVDIKQIAYPGRGWGKHIVVVDEDNLVYDPALSSQPMEKGVYFQKMFGKNESEIKFKMLDHIPIGPIKYN